MGLQQCSQRHVWMRPGRCQRSMPHATVLTLTTREVHSTPVLHSWSLHWQEMTKAWVWCSVVVLCWDFLCRYLVLRRFSVQLWCSTLCACPFMCSLGAVPFFSRGVEEQQLPSVRRRLCVACAAVHPPGCSKYGVTVLLMCERCHRDSLRQCAFCAWFAAPFQVGRCCSVRISRRVVEVPPCHALLIPSHVSAICVTCCFPIASLSGVSTSWAAAACPKNAHLAAASSTVWLLFLIKTWARLCYVDISIAILYSMPHSQYSAGCSSQEIWLMMFLAL